MKQQCLRVCFAWICVVGLTLVSVSAAAAEGVSKLDQPILEGAFVEYFAAKPMVRVDVSVEDAAGKGEKALDFFLIEPNGRVENIPTTLASILPRSRLLEVAIKTLLRSESGESRMLKITESLSEPVGREKVNGFIGVTAEDVSLEDLLSEECAYLGRGAAAEEAPADVVVVKVHGIQLTEEVQGAVIEDFRSRPRAVLDMRGVKLCTDGIMSAFLARLRTEGLLGNIRVLKLPGGPACLGVSIRLTSF